MNIKNLAIIAALALLITAVVSFIFLKELMKASSPVPLAPPAGQVARDEAKAVYAIPKNSAPNAVENEKAVNAAAKERAAADEMIATVKAKSALTRKEIMDSLRKAESVPEETQIKATQEKADPSTRQIVSNPTREEREDMKARGVIAY